MIERVMTFWEKTEKLVISILLAGSACLALYALHDMHTAEGVGLYFAILRNDTNRMAYDIMTDVVCMGLFAVFMFVPWRLRREHTVSSLFRLFAAALAFFPTISVARMAHLIMGTEPVTLNEALRQGEFLQVLFGDVSYLFSGLRAGVPALLLLLAISCLDNGTKSSTKVYVGVAVMALLLVGILFPALQVPCWFATVYILLVSGFNLWERLWKEYPAMRFWGWLLFFAIWCRGVYRLLEVLSAYNI